MDPQPVLLVPGWSDTARQLRHARQHLLRAGWPETHVQAISFRDRYGCNIEHADELAGAVAALLAATGASQASIIAHSMGGLATRRYLSDGGGGAVRSVIFAGTPHRGTLLAHAAWGAGGAQMKPGSAFLRDLAERPIPEGVRAWCLRTPLDLRIIPGSSAWLDGTECISVRALRHQWLLRDRAVLRTVTALLRSR